MRRLGVLGTFVWDTIHHPSSPAPREQWGGIAYAFSSFGAVCPPGWDVEPLVKIGSDLADEADRYLAEIPHLVAPWLLRVPAATNRVELRYHDQARRDERLIGGVPPWRTAELLPLLEPLSALHVNFISGLELTLETAQQIRSSFGGPIYADLHSLFLDPPGKGPRRARPLPRWREWVACFDVVQLNEDELGLLAAGGDPWDLGAEICDLGPRLVAVTRGAEGVALREVGGSHWVQVAVPGGPAAGDPTGCGDVWGAAFSILLLAGADPETAAARASSMAARKLAHPSTEGLWRALAADS